MIIQSITIDKIKKNLINIYGIWIHLIMDMNFQYITIIILLITSNTYSFNSGELIDANNLNSKFNSYQLALSKINININFEDL